jgi:hypothetical protein
VTLTTISGTALLVPGVLAAAAPPGPTETRPAGTRGRFAACVGEPFLVQDESGEPVPLVLREVSDPTVLGAPGLEGHPECFSASFLGPAGRLRQGTFTVSNARLGRLALFLVPVGRPRDGAQQYEAAFNCAVPS